MASYEMGLKKRAIAAYKEQQEHAAEKEQHRFAQRAVATATAFEKMFGEKVSVKLGTCDTIVYSPEVEMDAVFTTALVNNIFSFFKLRGRCPNCGIDCYSKGIHGLNDLGEQIKSFSPGYGHQCITTPESPTAGKVLLEALQDFICELEED